MRSPIDDPDLEIPDFDFSRPTLPNRVAVKPGEKTEICVDGAVGYALRLIPSNKVLARFASTLEAWPVIIATVEAGRSPRTLSLDWLDADGRFESVSAGPRLERWARLNNGEPHPCADRAVPPVRRIAEPA